DVLKGGRGDFVYLLLLRDQVLAQLGQRQGHVGEVQLLETADRPGVRFGQARGSGHVALMNAVDGPPAAAGAKGKLDDEHPLPRLELLRLEAVQLRLAENAILREHAIERQQSAGYRVFPHSRHLPGLVGSACPEVPSLYARRPAAPAWPPRRPRPAPPESR